MKKRSLLFPLLCLPLLLLLVSCERLNTGAVQVQTVKLHSIPAKYGQLKAVTQTDGYAGWGHLWFEDSAGTITLVRVDWERREMVEEPLVITRTPAATEGSKP